LGLSDSASLFYWDLSEAYAMGNCRHVARPSLLHAVRISVRLFAQRAKSCLRWEKISFWRASFISRSGPLFCL